jgi:hypothetical protein
MAHSRIVFIRHAEKPIPPAMAGILANAPPAGDGDRPIT